MELHESVCGGRFSLYYHPDLFKPGTDSFLLGDFAAPRKGDKVCDLGAGTGLLGLLLFARQNELTVANVELQERSIALAEKSFRESGLIDRCTFHHGDLKDRKILPPAGSMDYVVSNPPYYSPAAGQTPLSDPLRTARTEDSCTLADVANAAKYLLRWGGRFAMVHRAERLTDVLCTLREHGLEPKRLRLAQHRADSAPSILLVEAVRGGKSGLITEPTLILHGADNRETAELQRINFRQEQEL